MIAEPHKRSIDMSYSITNNRMIFNHKFYVFFIYFFLTLSLYFPSFSFLFSFCRTKNEHLFSILNRKKYSIKINILFIKMDTTAFREDDSGDWKGTTVSVSDDQFLLNCFVQDRYIIDYLSALSLSLLFPIRHLFYSIDLYGANIVIWMREREKKKWTEPKFSEPNKWYCTYNWFSH